MGSQAIDNVYNYLTISIGIIDLGKISLKFSVLIKVVSC